MAQHQHLVHRHHLLPHHHRSLIMKIPWMGASLMKSPFKSKVLLVLSARQSAACSQNVHQTSPQELQQHRNVLCRMLRHIASTAHSSAAQVLTTSVDRMHHARAFNPLAYALTMMMRSPPAFWKPYTARTPHKRSWCRSISEPHSIVFCKFAHGILVHMPCQDEFVTTSTSLCGGASKGVVKDDLGSFVV